MNYYRFPIYIGMHRNKVWGYNLEYELWLHKTETSVKRDGMYWSNEIAYVVNFTVVNFWELPKDFRDAYHDVIIDYGKEYCKRLTYVANNYTEVTYKIKFDIQDILTTLFNMVIEDN